MQNSKPPATSNSVSNIEYVRSQTTKIIKDLSYVSKTLNQRKYAIGAKPNEFRRRHWACLSDIQHLEKYLNIRFILALAINSVVYLSTLVLIKPSVSNDILISIYFIFLALASISIIPVFNFYFFRRVQVIDQKTQVLLKDFKEFDL